ncbi:MAG: hypothetical protein COB35_02050 [Gammaproteobacteria bacterium]|nr:MAG: hypothetical protein COB35_02050 [Gammaproteobacteria bacterium]
MIKSNKNTILIVDDDPMFLLTLRQFFEKEDYHVEQAVNGKEAIAIFSTCQLSCILMDVKMPLMNGFDACRAIRALPEGDSVPIIMVTIKDSETVVDQCYEVGGSDYINKPIHWAALRNRVRNLIAKNSAEKKIKESKNKLNRAQAIAHMGNWELNGMENQSLNCSDELFRIFEITPNNTNASFDILLHKVHPKDRAIVDEAHTHALKTQETFSLEYRLLMADGRIKWVLEQCKNIFTNDDKPLHSMGTIQDISEHKKATESLQLISQLSARAAGEGFFQALISASAKALGIKIAFVTELLPYTEATAKTLALWVDGNILENIEYPLADTPCENILNGKVIGFSKGLQQLFPKDKWLADVNAESYVCIPFMDDTGHVIGHMGIMDDKPITDQQKIINIMRIFADRATAELKQKQSNASLHKLSQALKQSGESIIITDSDGIIEYTNPAFTQISGYNKEDTIGKTPRILNSGNQNNTFYDAMWKIITNGEVWHDKVINKKKDGSLYPAILTISPIMNNAGTITHFVGSHADLTEFEKMEQQFQKSQKMEAIGTLVGGVAHDFNNMLAVITGNLYLAKKEIQFDTTILQRLINIENITLRAADMISQLLTFARKNQVKIGSLPLTPFMKETLKLLHASVPENITLLQKICSNKLEIKGDHTLLHQVLMNLINNARDAVEHVDEPCITIALESFFTNDEFLKIHPYFKKRSYAHLSVSDNGCGISNDQREHLFEPFFTTKEQGKGTGLGLSMVFGAIKTHDGFIEVDSIKNKGTTFHIYIPLIEQKDTYSASLQKNSTSEGHGELILLADDEVMVREMMVEVLKTLNYRVLQAKDGLQAIEIFKAHQEDINLLLLDVVMPHGGGISLATQIRKIKPTIPVIFLTGYDKNHVLEGNKPLPNSGILSKPVKFTILNQHIRHFLD